MRHYFLIIFTLLCLSGFSSPAPTEEVSIIVELEDNPDTFISEIESRLPRLDIIAQYDTIFNGVAIRGTARELEKLVRMDAVINQYPVHTYRTLGQKSRAFSTEKIRQQLQLPVTGKGVKVGVIDTGVDYTHLDLQKNYRGGFDTVDFDEDPMETEGEGATLHGTHVAGVIAADGEMKGVAPDAEIYAYRALGPGGMGSSVQVIAALEEAVEDGVDVINLSLGNDVNGPDWPTTHAVNKAVELGVVVVVAAGNSGPGSWTVGSPATSSDAITVGASALSLKAPFLKVPGEKTLLPLQVLSGSTEWNLDKKYPVIDVGTGEREIEDLSGKIALFKRGGIPFSQKAMKAYKAGAVAVLIYNHKEGGFRGSLEGLTIPVPVAALSKKGGEWLSKKTVQEGQWVQTVQKSLEDQIAPFSSRGPVTTSWEIKPDIVAPGIDVWSTVPGGYEPLQGTSMAAPHVAGAVALIKEAYPDWTPSQVKSALKSSAELIFSEEHPFPPTQQGAGFMDINKALEPSLLIDQGSLAFGKVDDDFFRKELPLKVTNPTDEQIRLQIERPALKNGESWTVPRSITLDPKQTREVTIRLRISSAFLDPGIYQGYLIAKTGDQEYGIPYVYVKERSDYEKVSGFEITTDWRDERTATYRFHLSEAAEKISVDLYRAGTMFAHGTLMELEEVQSGMVEGQVTLKNRNLEGAYIAVVHVKTKNEKDSYTFPVRFG